MVAITKFTREDILDAVRLMYTSLANDPHKDYHFPTGRAACEFLGYPAEQLNAVTPGALESFAGVGYPFRCEVIRPGNVVLDIGAGAGTDAFIASLLTGPGGRVYGLDMTRAMNEKFARNIARAGATNVEPLHGNAEQIPLPDASVDVVTSNGVLNLVPDKTRALSEIFRVLRPGGRIQVSDVVITRRTDDLEEIRDYAHLWAECIVGALAREEFACSFEAAGFTDLRLHGDADYFSRSTSDSTRETAAYFGATSLTVSARKS
jgi:arsenite methyltransferase